MDFVIMHHSHLHVSKKWYHHYHGLGKSFKTFEYSNVWSGIGGHLVVLHLCKMEVDFFYFCYILWPHTTFLGRDCCLQIHQDNLVDLFCCHFLYSEQVSHQMGNGFVALFFFLSLSLSIKLTWKDVLFVNVVCNAPCSDGCHSIFFFLSISSPVRLQTNCFWEMNCVASCLSGSHFRFSFSFPLSTVHFFRFWHFPLYWNIDPLCWIFVKS